MNHTTYKILVKLLDILYCCCCCSCCNDCCDCCCDNNNNNVEPNTNQMKTETEDAIATMDLKLPTPAELDRPKLTKTTSEASAVIMASATSVASAVIMANNTPNKPTPSSKRATIN